MKENRYWKYTALVVTVSLILQFSSEILFSSSSLADPLNPQIIARHGLIAFLGWLGALALKHLLFKLGERGLAGMVMSNETYSTNPNELKTISLEAGSSVSQPSALHGYRFCVLRLTPGKELCITLTYRTEEIGYWSLVVYDRYGLPLPQYAFDENCRVSQEENGDLRVVICLKRNGATKRGESGTKHGNTDTTNVNFIDVSKVEGLGYVILRSIKGDFRNVSCSHVTLVDQLKEKSS